MADVLFTATQQRVVGALFSQPDRSFYVSELIEASEGGRGAVQRELLRLEEVGLIASKRVGNQKYFQANRDSPIFEELHGIAVKTFGIADILRSALEPLSDRIVAAFVYGSIAKGRDKAASDVDLMIIGNKLAYPDVIEHLQRAEARLDRPVNPTIYSPSEFQKKRADKDGFVARVMSQSRIAIMGDADGL